MRIIVILILLLQICSAQMIGKDNNQSNYLLQIISEPSDANVYINSEKIGKTPIDYYYDSKENGCVITIEKTDYLSISDTIIFNQVSFRQKVYQLQPSGHLLIHGILGSELFINNEIVWNSDSLVTQEFLKTKRFGDKDILIVYDLVLSDYEIKMFRENYKTFNYTVQLTQNVTSCNVFPQFELKSGNIIIKNGDIASLVQLDSKFSKTTFNLEPNKIDTVNTFFGDYLITASSNYYIPFTKKITLYSDKSEITTISMSNPKMNKALIRSAVLPGWGQHYSFQKKKAILFSTIFIPNLSWQLYSYISYYNELQDYNKYYDLYNDAQTVSDMNKYRLLCNNSKSNLITHKKHFYTAAGMCLATYIINIIDIKYFFPEHRYINNIGFNIKPESKQYEICYKF